MNRVLPRLCPIDSSQLLELRIAQRQCKNIHRLEDQHPTDDSTPEPIQMHRIEELDIVQQIAFGQPVARRDPSVLALVQHSPGVEFTRPVLAMHHHVVHEFVPVQDDGALVFGVMVTTLRGSALERDYEDVRLDNLLGDNMALAHWCLLRVCLFC